MKISVTKTIVEYIDIQFPYFYVHDLSDESQEYVIYGKILENEMITIRETMSYDNTDTTYEIVRREHTTFEGLTTYLTDPIHKSSKSDFDAIKARLRSFIISRMSR